MARVWYKNRRIEAETGALLSEVIRLMGIRIETPCSCMGMCRKCLVEVRGELSPRDEAEEALPEGSRLACMTRVAGDVEIVKISREKLHISEAETELPPDTEGKGRVLAIDLGTTGVSARVIDLSSSKVVGRYSGLNYQSEYGADVVSRITYSIKNGTGDLQDAIIRQIEDIVRETGGAERIAIAGNTTMQHLISGEDPRSMAAAPYTPVFLDERIVRIGGREAVLLPGASSYVGADILAGVSAVELAERSNALFIDIGTNGEMVLSADGALHGTSTAAGPAFEGMNIQWGMRAEKGAIESFKIEDGFTIKTIGGAPPRGICGSGLMDIVSELVRHRIVVKSGRFNPRMKPEFQDRLRDKKFYITEEIYVSQGDIREIQLAKGAIAAGVKLLLSRAGRSIGDIEEVIIAGSFGYHLNPESIRTLGVIPEYKGVISFAGNTSLNGCIGYLASDRMRERIRNTIIDVIELSGNPEFQDVFIRELQF